MVGRLIVESDRIVVLARTMRDTHHISASMAQDDQDEQQSKRGGPTTNKSAAITCATRSHRHGAQAGAGVPPRHEPAPEMHSVAPGFAPSFC
jgi:hypothetical protein